MKRYISYIIYEKSRSGVPWKSDFTELYYWNNENISEYSKFISEASFKKLLEFSKSRSPGIIPVGTGFKRVKRHSSNITRYLANKKNNIFEGNERYLFHHREVLIFSFQRIIDTSE
ncbi:hypothetical protein Lal_00044955 [Lupinus albus]|nr:hypothetical protein Lal_00044955 [Lupinus albus]